MKKGVHMINGRLVAKRPEEVAVDSGKLDAVFARATAGVAGGT